MEASRLPDIKSNILRCINSCTSNYQLAGAGSCITFFQKLFEKAISKEEMKLHISDMEREWNAMYEIFNPAEIITNDD